MEQISSGNEWLALKRDGGAWKTFDSLSLYHMLKSGGADHFREYIGRLRETPWQDLKYPGPDAQTAPMMSL